MFEDGRRYAERAFRPRGRARHRDRLACRSPTARCSGSELARVETLVGGPSQARSPCAEACDAGVPARVHEGVPAHARERAVESSPRPLGARRFHAAVRRRWPRACAPSDELATTHRQARSRNHPDWSRDVLARTGGRRPRPDGNPERTAGPGSSKLPAAAVAGRADPDLPRALEADRVETMAEKGIVCHRVSVAARPSRRGAEGERFSKSAQPRCKGTQLAEVPGVVAVEKLGCTRARGERPPPRLDEHRRGQCDALSCPAGLEIAIASSSTPRLAGRVLTRHRLRCARSRSGLSALSRVRPRGSAQAARSPMRSARPREAERGEVERFGARGDLGADWPRFRHPDAPVLLTLPPSTAT